MLHAAHDNIEKIAVVTFNPRISVFSSVFSSVFCTIKTSSSEISAKLDARDNAWSSKFLDLNGQLALKTNFWSGNKDEISGKNDQN